MPRASARPSVELMETRALLSATPARAAEVAVLNPGLGAIGSDGMPGISSTRPQTLQFVVLSQAGPTTFAPLSTLIPRTFRVDGLAFRNVTIRPAPADLNGDGISDAVVSIRTRGAMELPPGPGVLIVTGLTRHRAGLPIVVFASAAAIDVPPPLSPLPIGQGSGGGPSGQAGGGAMGGRSDVGEGSGLGVGGTGFILYNGYINIIDDTPNTVYDSLLVNTPPGGSPAAYPGTYLPLVPHQTLQVYTGPGTPDQLAITANFSASRSGASPFYAVWYSRHMTLVNTFPIPPVINWYLHQNSSGQFYFNNTP